jgi:exonuclease SbcC
LEAEALQLRPLAALAGTRAEAAGKLAIALKAARERDVAKVAAAAKAAEVATAEQQAAGAREEAVRAQREVADLSAAREGGLAAWMAQEKLQPGKPCPVCGATEHPTPAEAEGQVPEKEAVDGARAVAKAMDDRAAAAAANLAGLATLLTELRDRASAAAAAEARPVAELRAALTAGENSAGKAQAAIERLGSLDGKLVVAREAVKDSRARAEKAASIIADSRAVLGRIEAARSELARQLEASGVGPGAAEESAQAVAELKKLEVQAEAARNAQQSATTRHTVATTSLHAAEKARGRAATAARQANSAAEAARKAEGFEDLASCQAALLAAPARQAIATSVEKRANAAFAASQKVSDLDIALGGLVDPDVSAALLARSETERAAREAGDRRVRLEENANHLQGLVDRHGALQAELAEVEDRLVVVGHVAQLVSGQNPMGMSLQRFVLAARLEEVAEAATARLLLMSRGRFRLHHDTAVARKNSAAGLSLVVEDTWTGVMDRPVGALSGGESFLASLALALGLSDVVLRRSGGRRLDALFVDEGFGTLDEATLDVAIRALETLQQAGRLVGVISHVAELRRRIPARIEVVLGEQGSVAVVRP